MTDHPAPSRPSSWFAWHAFRIAAGARVLDLACGTGRHAIAAARLGAEVVAADRDATRLTLGRRLADDAGVAVAWHEVDLAGPWPDWGVFDAILLFNYLDRPRMARIVEHVAPGGILLMETFRVAQRAEGWGPVSDAHLLRPGELWRLAAPLEIVHGREAIEPTDDGRWRHIASLCATRPR